jgi:Tfp pilus assembly protein PilO
MNRLRSVNLDLLKSKVVLIATGTVIVLLIVWWFAWMSPEGTKLTSVQQQVTSDQSMVTQLNAELRALQAEKQLVLQELPYLKKVTTAIPPTVDPPGIVDQLYTLAVKTGCKLGSVSTTNTTTPSATAGLATIPVSFTVSGAHRSIFTFLTDFYTLQRLITINTVSLSPAGTSPNILAIGDGQQYTMTVTAQAYTTLVAPAATA